MGILLIGVVANVTVSAEASAVKTMRFNVSSVAHIRSSDHLINEFDNVVTFERNLSGCDTKPRVVGVKRVRCPRRELWHFDQARLDAIPWLGIL